ncbi:Chaperone protein dnaJ [Microbotryomycetes sp. JL221]|nr:Chaperone protein dnaJ [Microbotryomycetes sp. JL221]
MNAEQASAALDIARRHYNAGNYEAGIRFAKKSLALHQTQEAASLLQKLEVASASDAASASTTTGANARASTSGASSAAKRPSVSTKAPSTAASDEKPREFTPAQAATVKRVRACRVTEYYEILGLDKKCSDNDVKKAYRKLALSLHPDKCGAPGAEEAFKMVSKAFQVLSDGNKRTIFDQTGGDPDSRGGGGGPSFARNGGAGPTFDGDELSPEDLFRFFFGGQGGASPFGGHAGFGGASPFGGGSFQFYGPGGIRMSTGGSGGRAAGFNGQHGQRQQQGSMWLQVAPLLLLFLFSLLSQLPSLFGTSAPADPDFSFERIPRFNIERTTSNMGVKYFVNPTQFATHPIFDALVRENPQLGFSSKHEPETNAYRSDLVKFLRMQSETTGGQTVAPVIKVPAPVAKFERKALEQTWKR